MMKETENDIIMRDKNEYKKITPKEENFSRWYRDIIRVAELAENAPVKGFMIIKPYGYAIWEMTRDVLDKKFKETGIENAYFPLLIPESLLKKEEEHVEGFSPEVAVVTIAGGKKLKKALVIRPTSETIIYHTFSSWIESHRDLPLLINQWANVVRWEKRPRLFLRTTEFLWQEGHTAHATEKEADERARMMLKEYKNFAEEYMAIPVVTGIKSEAEKFAGAKHTYTVEAMMQDGKALQFATSHNLGQNFSKAFDIEFTAEDGSSQYCWQTSWGLSTRTIGALIMVHGDNKGLVLPPKIAPLQLVTIPIWHDEKSKALVLEKIDAILKQLKESGITKIKTDNRDIRPGEKYYEWEKKGVPIRMEVGPRDIKNNTLVLVRRDTGEKITVSYDNLLEKIKEMLEDIQNNLYKRALRRMKEKTKEVDSWSEFVKEIGEGNFVFAHWSGDSSVEEKIKEETKATVRCFPLEQEREEGSCVYSGKPSKGKVLFAKAY